MESVFWINDKYAYLLEREEESEQLKVAMLDRISVRQRIFQHWILCGKWSLSDSVMLVYNDHFCLLFRLIGAKLNFRE